MSFLPLCHPGRRWCRPLWVTQAVGETVHLGLNAVPSTACNILPISSFLLSFSFFSFSLSLSFFLFLFLLFLFLSPSLFLFSFYLLFSSFSLSSLFLPFLHSISLFLFSISAPFLYLLLFLSLPFFLFFSLSFSLPLSFFLLSFSFWDRVLLYHSGWSAAVWVWLTADLTSQFYLYLSWNQL